MRGQGKDLSDSMTKPVTPNQQNIDVRVSQIGSKNEVDEKGSLTPRQEPQGEESTNPELATPPKYNYSALNTQYQGQSNHLEHSPMTKRAQANSNPVQFTQPSHHNLNPKQTRSLDLSPQQDPIPRGVTGINYNPPPSYGAHRELLAMHDKSAVHVNTNGAAYNHHLHQQTKKNADVNNTQLNEHSLPPPPEYPGNRADIRRSFEMLDSTASANNIHQSSSHPELSHPSSSLYQNHHASKPVPVAPQQIHRASNDQAQDFAAVAARASKMVDVLSEENKSLRSELENYYRKVSRLQKFELELQRVHDAHENLVKSSIKKEGIEKAIRMRQEMEIKKLDDQNKQFREKLNKLDKKLTEQTAKISELTSSVSERDEQVDQLTILTTEQREELEQNVSKLESVLRQLEIEQQKCSSLEEELTAYKSNASAIMEEESEVRMAALQQCTKDSERIIQEAQTEKLRYMDEAHQACKRVALLEAKLKALEASCAEKDAMVRVLQRRQRSNLSGRGQHSPSSLGGSHLKQTSEPSAPVHQSRVSVENLVQVEQLSPSDTLEAETWQV